MSFTLFDSLQFANMPVSGLPVAATSGSDIASTRAQVQSRIAEQTKTSDLIVLDIELDLMDSAIRTAVVHQLQWAYSATYRLLRGHLPVGLFGFPSPWRIVELQSWDDGHANWGTTQTQHDALATLMGARVNFLAPEHYARYRYSDTVNGNQAMLFRYWLMLSVAEIRRQFPKKPIYPFLCPQYVSGGDANDLICQFIPEWAWLMMLDACKRYANGAIVWSGWKDKFSARMEWSEAPAWFQKMSWAT